nr:hypothetical protein [Tanacetum cinerariifolium]
MADCDMSSFIIWFCKRIGKKKLHKADLEGLTFKVVRPFHDNNISLLFQMEECHLMLTNQVDLVNPEGHRVVPYVSKPFPLKGPPESDCESWPPTSLYDRFQPSDGYHVIPPSYTGTFMPPKPDLVFNTTPTAIETDHSAFIVQLSPTKPEQDLSHTNRPTAPIIKDWVSDSKDESETKASQIVPSFVQSSDSGKRRNRKACFVYKSVDHLIKDCNYHAKKMAQPTPRNHAHRGNHKQYAPLTHINPQKHMVPAAILTQSKPVSITVVRPVSAVVPKIKVTQPRYSNPIVTKSKSPIRRHLTRSPSPMTSNSPPRVTVVKALVGNPQHALKDKGVIDSGCSRHMTRNMSYLSDFEELNG